jgi:hypothetical protein
LVGRSNSKRGRDVLTIIDVDRETIKTQTEEDQMRLAKITALKNGNQLFAYWANNRGRGSDNCTLLVVPANEQRPNFSRDVENIISKTRTSSWRGLVNLSADVCNRLGITKQDL